MSLATTYDNPVIEWDESVEHILSELGDEAQINAFLHKKSHEYYTKQNIKYQLPIIIFSALSGTGNFISANFPLFAVLFVVLFAVLFAMVGS
jgi:hypothetical protein